MIASSHVEPAFACGVAPPGVLLFVWRLPPTAEAVDRAMAAFDRCADAIGGPFSALVLIEATSPPPEPEVRARIEAFFDAHERLQAHVAVLVGRPAWLTWGMDVALQIASRRVRGRRSKVCVDVAEGIAWLGRISEPPIDAGGRAAIEAALAELVAALPPA